MPSWPPQLHPKPRARALKSPPIYDYEGRTEDNTYHDQPLHGVPVVASTGASSSSRPGHGRSHSHPLPSMFGTGNRAEKITELVFSDDIPETLNESPSTSTKLASKDHKAANKAANGTLLQSGENHLVTGKCVTCDSRVRWPRHLNVFRCTVCLMVNDMKPGPGLLIGGLEAEGPSTMTPSSIPGSSRKAVPCLSLHRIRSLIDQCISQYLQLRLEHGLNHRPALGKLQGKRDECKHPSAPEDSGLGALNHGCIAPTIQSSSRFPQPAPQAPSIQITRTAPECPEQHTKGSPRHMFWLLEDYITSCFGSVECINKSFLTVRPHNLLRAASEGTVEKCTDSRVEDRFVHETPFPELDAKTLLLGDFAENGTWWTGRSHVEQARAQINSMKLGGGDSEDKGYSKSPRINWAELDEWYYTVITAGRTWRDPSNEKQMSMLASATAEDVEQIEDDFAEACAHVQRTLLKVTENLLRRPGQPLKTPEDCRFLLVLLKNPLLYEFEVGNGNQSTNAKFRMSAAHSQRTAPQPVMHSLRQTSISDQRFLNPQSGSTGKHSSIIKRILGLMSNLPSDCHHHLIVWFSRFSEGQFRKIVELVGSFVTYRLTRQHGRKRSNSHDPHGGLIPNIAGPGPGSSAQLHAALSISGAPKAPERNDFGVPYSEDWQIKAAARVMSLLFSANNQGSSRRNESPKSFSSAAGRSRAVSAARTRAHRHGQLLPTNAFYNTLLDCADLVADFEGWESRRGRFSFCQYPMFLSIWAKIRIMEHDARRQMEIKAREAFFHSIMSRKAINQYLVLKVRRDCLVEDSLRSVSEVVGTGQEEVKKGLRIEFLGEEGLDSGGLRKEWFLLLVREVFDPEHGLFVYDEDSQYCYFNPNTFETSDQFFLVGAVLGLAIYNSTILDVALPPFAFRKLLASAPNYTGPATSASRPKSGYTLEDLSEFRPTLAKGLSQLLEFDGDVKETFCRDFVAIGDRYGQLVEVPLCPNGENRAVTNSNRREFVDLYIRYLLDTSVTRQYEPFKRGFFTVCGGNALSLFRPEEIELLIRGSDEPLDVATLRAVAIYDGWGKGINASVEPVVDWFWDTFGKASAKDQRKLLSFITSSDRIPAMGATSLVIKITCLGDHSNRFPIARTCFNMIGLYRYRDRSVLEDKLWRAVIESEGFGIK